MAQAAPVAERGPSPLASKNPFRNLVSDTTAARPMSTNPFLDSNEIISSDAAAKTAPTTATEKVASQASVTETTANLFASLEVDDPSSQPQLLANDVSRRENMPPPRYPGRGPPPRHRPSNSEEERRRQQGKPRGLPNELDIFADPPDPNRLRNRHAPPRRNSESSVRTKSKDLDAEAEKRRQERKLREGKSSSRSKKPSRRLDVIDKLDVTSIYGTGLFHHDGPFDACNPHRNRKTARQAPMQAFPKDSLNMALGGAGPNNSKLNLEQIHGRGQEAHFDFNEAVARDADAEYMRRPLPERTPSFNPTAKAEPVHGNESIGLGTSTFLEGAPASRAAIQRREIEQEAQQQAMAQAGLSRKKSLAQRIKAVRPRVNDTGRMTSPEPFPAGSPLGSGRSDQNGANPFFQEYDKEYEKKGAQIAFVEEQAKNAGRARAPSSPKRGGLTLTRSLTAESAGLPSEDSKSGGGGFMSRVKSIKGRGKTRERRNTEASS